MKSRSKAIRLSHLVVLTALLPACREQNVEAQQAKTNAQQQVREQLGPVPAGLDTATAARLSGAFRGAADKALPAVVQIRVTTQIDAGGQQGRRFQLPFRIPGLPDDFDPEGPQRTRGTGSGFIFDERGYVLTNNHVVANAADVRVVLVTGREYDGKVVGTDPDTDVAVVKIEPRNGERLPVAQIGSSDRLRVGDWVLALGSPLGLDFTVTAGIVSAFGRNVGIIEGTAPRQGLESFIQTDAAINPGNSGGPLVDLLGNVIGVNTAIQSSTGFFAGAGFAIPIDLAYKNAHDIIKYGVVHRPRLGVEVGPIREADAEVFKLPTVAGAKIVSVQPGLAADKAGIQMGDVVVALDGKPVRTREQFMAELAEKSPGDEARLSIIRYGQRIEKTVKLGEFAPPSRERPVADRRPPAEQLLGFKVTPLSPQLAQSMRMDPRAANNQLVVTDIDRYSAAAEAGVTPGLEIISINGQRVDSAADVERIASRLKVGDVVTVIAQDPTDSGNTNRIYNFRVRR